MYQTFTHLVQDTTENLAQAHRAETQRLRTNQGDGHENGIARTRGAVLSPIGIDRILHADEVTPGIIGPGFTDENLTLAVVVRLEKMLREKATDIVEAIRFLDNQGRAGWFFYGWAQCSSGATLA